MERYEIDKLKEIPIEDVCSRLGIKVVRGWMLCPHHTDHNPSCHIDKSRNRVKCFACGYGPSDTIGITQEVLGLSFLEATQWLAREYGQPLSHRQPLSPDPFPRSGDRGSIIYFNLKYVNDLVTGHDSLSKCLLHLFDAETVGRVARAYQMGCWTDRRYVDNTLFPIIDSQGRCHNLKLQHYDTNTKSEQFAHCDKKHTFWLGALLQREGKLSTGRFDHEVLFGEHLLARHPNSVVGLVESPKNAVVCACQWPDIVWVATGNKGMLKRSVLLPLRGRDVLVYPDEDAREEWSKKLEEMRDVANFHIAAPLPPPEGEAATGKSDIADVIIASLMS